MLSAEVTELVHIAERSFWPTRPTRAAVTQRRHTLPNGTRYRRRRWCWWRDPAAVQRIVHRDQQAIHEDALDVLDALEGWAGADLGVTQGDVHGEDQLVDGHCAIAVTVADACNRWRGGGRRGCKRHTDTIALLRGARRAWLTWRVTRARCLRYRCRAMGKPQARCSQEHRFNRTTLPASTNHRGPSSLAWLNSRYPQVR